MERQKWFVLCTVVLLLTVTNNLPTSVQPVRAETQTTSSSKSVENQRFIPLMVSLPPQITFTFVPPYGSFTNLRGKVTGITPADYRVAVYIYGGGWWNKPTWASSLTTIRTDGSWTCDITTGENDELATRLAAFVLPAGYQPPLLSGNAELPAELYHRAVVYREEDRSPTLRKIVFAGREWLVKASANPVGPGPNHFSDRTQDVWVDADGLHLTITYHDGVWWCTEIFSAESLGYGTYTFTLAGAVDQINPNAVLGLFTWDDTSSLENHREIDVEVSRWGETSAQNTQFVVQPWDHAGNRQRFDMVLTKNLSTHQFTWAESEVQFTSYQGNAASPAPEDVFQSWKYTGADIPHHGEENVHLNLWLYNSAPPSDGNPLEVVVKDFLFTPAP